MCPGLRLPLVNLVEITLNEANSCVCALAVCRYKLRQLLCSLFIALHGETEQKRVRRNHVCCRRGRRRHCDVLPSFRQWLPSLDANDAQTVWTTCTSIHFGKMRMVVSKLAIFEGRARLCARDDRHSPGALPLSCKNTTTPQPVANSLIMVRGPAGSKPVSWRSRRIARAAHRQTPSDHMPMRWPR